MAGRSAFIRDALLPAEGRPAWRAGLAVGLVSAAMALLVALGDTAQRLDWASYDAFVRTATRNPTPPDDIVIVAIDEPSFREIGLAWPWPRRLHAALVDALVNAGARAVVFDVLFDVESPDPEDDLLFADALARAGRVVLASDRGEVVDRSFTIRTWIDPVPTLRSAAAATGAVTLPLDPDGVVRRAQATVDGRASLAVAVRETLQAGSQAEFRGPGGRTDDTARPRLLRYFGTSRRGIVTVSYYQALEADSLLPGGFFRRRVVFVGRALQASPDGGADRFATSVEPQMPGVEILATHFAALTGAGFVRDPFESMPRTALLVLGFVAAAWLVAARTGPIATMVAIVAVTLAVPAIAYAALAVSQVRLPVVPPAAAFAVQGIAVSAWRASLVGRQRRAIRRAFEHYVSPVIVAELVRDPSKLALGGDEYELTVLFADLEGFTTLAERLPPSEVRARLGACLEVLVASVLAHAGTLDKLLGDGLVALFGCPVRSPDHARQACEAALEMHARVRKLGLEWAQEGVTAPRLRVGIASGRAVAGNFGTSTVFQFTAVGDVVNMAARLEGANKVYRTGTLVAAGTAAAVRDRLSVRDVDLVRLKGRRAAEPIYELREGSGGDGEASAAEASADTYGLALARYRARDFAGALRLLDAAIAGGASDGPTAVLRERCTRYVAEPPGPEWDGAFEMTTK